MELITPTEKSIGYMSGYKYQTKGDLSYLIPSLEPYIGAKTPWLEIKDGGLLCIKSGYAWDGASGPTLDTKTSMRGSLIHDALYQLMRQGFISTDYKDTADEIFKEICIKDKMWEWRANSWKTGLDLFGGNNVKASRRKKINYAP